MDQLQKSGKKILSKLIKGNNHVGLEKAIYNAAASTSSDDTEMQQNYRFYLYQIVGDLMNDVKVRTIIKYTSAGEIGWNHEMFSDMRRKRIEQDTFIEKPFEVEEGVIECKCGSKRVYSYSKQCRGGDESMTTFAQCMSCKKKWTYSG
jgi:DNA-directed RNA polymerase subunit M/transcription elongation factor TFIIS